MRIAAFLPHVGVFGGVRRFIELGNAWTRMGHDVTLYHPEGGAPQWLVCLARTERLECAAVTQSDFAVCADPHTIEAFLSHRASSHLYYCVIEGDPGVRLALSHPEVRLAANSGTLCRALARRARRPVLDGVGGINLEQFRPDPSKRAASPLRVLINGRRSRRKKGTDLILRSLRGLERHAPPFEVVLFDHLGPENRQDPREGVKLPKHARFVINPTQNELTALYQSAHLFVAAERKAGWCNTALEAMACGAAVVCTGSGTTDFARHRKNAYRVRIRHPLFLRRAILELLRNDSLRSAIAAAGPKSARPWSWDLLAARLLDSRSLPTGEERQAIGPVGQAPPDRL